MEIKQEYDKIADKFTLPAFELLNRDFDIESIESSSYLLDKIRMKITEKTVALSKLLEETIYPDSGFSSLYESKYIKDKDKEKVYKLFKNLMKYNRYSYEVSFNNEDSKIAEFIIEFYGVWEKSKPELSKLFSILKTSWDIDTNIKEDLSYFG